jgi:hypothetical protein
VPRHSLNIKTLVADRLHPQAQPGISHMSNLWGAYPGPQITSANKTTFAAAQESLDHRLMLVPTALLTIVNTAL